MPTARHSETPVLIVGAGPVGLALANDLGQRGVACVIVDKATAHSPLPKMNHVNTRSMELCRRWGLAERVRRAGWPEDHPLDVAYVTRLGGHEIARFRFPSQRDRPRPDYTPEPSQRCPQIWFDPILERGLERYPHVELRRGVELESYESHEHGVRARLRAVDGAVQEIEAGFLVGADGAGSLVRRLAGIERESWGPAPWQVAISLRVHNFEKIQPERAAFFFVLTERGSSAVLTPTDGVGLWRFNANLPPDTAPDDFDPHAVIRAVGGPDLDYELIAVLPWQIRFTLAARYRSGRVLLVGDAARTLAPTGGLGMNTGLADAADLGWKLAALHEGWGGERLLDSYDAERRAVGRAINQESLANLGRVAALPRLAGIDAPGPEGERARREAGRILEQGDFRLEWVNDGAVLGARYADSPVIPAPDGEPPPYDPNRFTPRAFPGCRASHAWLPDGRSTLDLYGDGFVLLRFGEHAPGCGPLLRAAEERGVPLSIEPLPSPLADLYGAPLALVRPDGIVAWRGRAEPADPGALLDRVRGA